jgi:hypothetical protein
MAAVDLTDAGDGGGLVICQTFQQKIVFWD